MHRCKSLYLPSVSKALLSSLLMAFWKQALKAEIWCCQLQGPQDPTQETHKHPPASIPWPPLMKNSSILSPSPQVPIPLPFGVLMLLQHDGTQTVRPWHACVQTCNCSQIYSISIPYTHQGIQKVLASPFVSISKTAYALT